MARAPAPWYIPSVPSGGFRHRLLALLVVTGASVLASFAIADGLDPEAPRTIVIGDPLGPAPRDRVDPRRLGRAHTALPKAPEVLWRRDLAGSIDLPPVIDPKGGVIVALASPEVVRLDAEGKQAWRLRLGASRPVVPPAIAAGGSAVVVASDGSFWSVSLGGAVRFSTDLALATNKAAASPLPRADGSVVVAGNSGLVIVDAQGRIDARCELSDRPIGGLIPTSRGLVVPTFEGRVYRWQPPGKPVLVGDFGGRLDGGGSLASDKSLVAVVDGSRVVALDLVTASLTTLLGESVPLAPYEPTVVLTPGGLLLATTVIGELFAVDARATLVQRGALEPLPTMFTADAGAAVGAMLRTNTMHAGPPMVVDPGGRVAFARNSGRVGLVEPDGSILVAQARQCARPIALLPAGVGRMVVACRSGAVALFGDGKQP